MTLSPESSFPANALSNVVFPDPGDPNSRVILEEKEKGIIINSVKLIKMHGMNKKCNNLATLNYAKEINTFINKSNSHHNTVHTHI